MTLLLFLGKRNLVPGGLMIHRIVFPISLIALIFLANASALVGQSDGRRPLDHKDYDIWNTLGQRSISNDGKWIVYSVRPGKGVATLFIRELASKKQYVVKSGASARFSFDSQYLAYIIQPDPEVIKKLRAEKKKPDQFPKPKLEILNLKTGQYKTIPEVASFRFPEKAGGWIAYNAPKPQVGETVKTEQSKINETYEITPTGLKKSKPGKPSTTKKSKPKKEKKKSPGSTMVIRNLESGIEKRFPDVATYRFSKFGKRLAFAASSKQAERDGVFVVELATLQAKQIASGRGNYRALAFNEAENKVSFLTDREDFNAEKPSMAIYLWEDWEKEATKIASEKSAGIPKGWWIASVPPVFTEDGRRLLFSTQPKPEDAGKTKEQLDRKKKAKALAEPKAKLDLWHWKDSRLQPEQLLRAALERNRSYRALYDLQQKKVIQLANREIMSVNVDPRSTADIAVGINSEKYSIMRSWDIQSFSDIYIVDLKTGKANLVLKKVRGTGQLSPNGKFISWWDAERKKYFAMSVADRKPMDISATVPTSLANELHDAPSFPNPYGGAGWLDNDAAMLVYDRFDIWKLDPTGKQKAECLTKGVGRQTQTRYRYMRLDMERRTINPNDPMYLNTFNEKTKASGFAKCSTGDGKIETQLMLDESIGAFRKARQANTIFFTRQTFRRSPDIWVSSLDFKKLSRISNINPQQRDYLWGNAELVNFKSADGKPLEGILMKPDNFDPKKKYPMIVYFYERNSDNLHRYWAPAAGRSIINHSFYVSRGYIVFIPDIPYKVGYPGQSAYNAVVPGVKHVVDMGFVNEKKIGVQGHSWGGYQIAYLVTKTNIFACAESGAPVSNMTSAYGGIRWGSGMSRMFQYEKTQSRIGATLWKARDLYLENSPVFFADKIQTPLLILHNDKDTAVPWYQGIELFVAMRRLGKPAWMLNYNDEPHWVMKPENRIDFARRMQQFFDHYLQDAPEPQWLANGIPAVDKGKKFGFEPVEKKKPNSESTSSGGKPAGK